MKKFILLLLILLLPSVVMSATYYCDNAAADDTGDGSIGSPKKLITSGIGLMSGGDTLIVKNGTYTGSDNRIVGMPSGSAGAYTTIQAETDWGVTLNDTKLGTGDHQEPVNVNGKGYVKIQGFHLTGSIDAHSHYEVENSSCTKIVRCSSSGVTSEGYSFIAEGTSTYILFEECYSYGPGRYPFNVGGAGTTKYIVFRRCVCRWDYTIVQQPISCFNAYDVDHVYWQNCIAIDGTDNTLYPAFAYRGLKAFFNANGSDNEGYYGCIALNMEGAGIYLEQSPVSNITIQDCVLWGNKANSGGYPYTPLGIETDAAGPVVVSSCTIGGSLYPSGLLSYNSYLTFVNNIIYGMTAIGSGENDYAMGGHYHSDMWGGEDYNCLNNNNARNKAIALAANDITSDPLTGGLSYLTRIEAASTLAGAGQGGGQIGATILYKVGTDGTLYGDSGWNTITANSLWPFPNEAVMKAEMGAFSLAAGEAYTDSPAMSGARGFCTGISLGGYPQTLTRYIWEYLGNEIPATIYGDVKKSFYGTWRGGTL